MKKITKAVIGVCSAVVLCAGAFCIYRFAVLPALDYRAALSLMESGKYHGAVEILEDLGGYYDSEEKIDECRAAIWENEHSNMYARAEQFFASRDFVRAYELYCQLGYYRDSSVKKYECLFESGKRLFSRGDYTLGIRYFSVAMDSGEYYHKSLEYMYNKGVSVISEGKYDVAEEIFDALDSFSYSDAKLQAARYLMATDMLEHEKYEEARSVFFEIYRYRDSADMYNECYYRKALAYLEKGELEEARALLNRVNRYKDSAELMSKIFKYQQACGYMQNSTLTAIELFDELGDFLDSAEKKLQCIEKGYEEKYVAAKNHIESGDYSTAISLLVKIEGYKDSAELIKEAKYRRACLLIEKKSFSEAEKLFLELGDYKDSVLMREKEIPYRMVLAKYRDGWAESALAELLKLGGYKDSAEILEKVRTVIYDEALALIYQKRYVSAISKLELLGDYRDAPELILESKYLRAELLLTAISDSAYKAYQLYAELGDYKDSREKAAEALDASYNEAVKHLDAMQFDMAKDLFEKLGEYRDSAAMLTEVEYRRAVYYYSGYARKWCWNKALPIFESLGDYRDSRERVAEIMLADAEYNAAMKLMEQKMYSEAAEKFALLEAYRDSEIQYTHIMCVFAAEAYDSGDYEKAEELLENAPLSSESSEMLGKIYYARGKELYNAGKPKEALDRLDSIHCGEEARLLAMEIRNSPEYWRVAEVGDVLMLGKHPKLDKETPELIEWKVYKAEEGKIWLVSCYVIDCVSYASGAEGSSWEKSYMREWLNGEFFGSAFSDEEQAYLCSFSKAEGVADKVSLISREELSSVEEHVLVTLYAIQRGCYTGIVSWSGSVSNWFLIDGEGALDGQSYWHDLSQRSTGGVRPVICIEQK
ncbi:MAG: tetratricopeptide repeat protein [Clostridia bacterium]|nr:tetratricopeptide repeat protein [Clostridia bacterium]